MTEEELYDYEELWNKTSEIGRFIGKHMGKEHQDHYYLLCQLQYLCNELVPALDQFVHARLPGGEIKRIDLWRLGDRLLDDYLTCKHELEEIDRKDAERRAKEPPPLAP